MIPNVCTFHGVYGINSTAEDASVEPLMVQVLEANAGDAEALEEVSNSQLYFHSYVRV